MMIGYVADVCVLFKLPAGSSTGWRPMVFAGVVAVFGTPLFLYLLAHPALLRRRLRSGPFAERDTSQKIIMALVLLCLATLYAVIALDVHNNWSSVPPAIALAGDALVATGLLTILLVFRVNQFAAATIQVEAMQTVISIGPYRFIRHPLYGGMLLLFLGAPLALGSWWGLVPVFPLLALFIWRLLNEEKYLMAHLSGYKEYLERVTHRLIPGVW